MGEECFATQLIDGDGAFNVEGLERFIRAVHLADCGLSYAVVSIMGLRVADDTTFEKQISLFALAISDIVMINMWCHDIGREQAANRPLLKTVFQVMMRLFSPRKTTLLFVIRDKTKTPMKYLEPVLREDIQKIWSSISKPEAHKETALSEFFNVEVTALPSYEEKEEQFKEQVAQLRQRFFNSIAPGGLAGDRRGVIPGSAFSFSAQQIWALIRENKDLDLPAHKVMVATVRCEEIANEKLGRLASDENWLELKTAVQSGRVAGFGRKLSSILDFYLSEYDMEAAYFDEGVRTAKREQLESGALNYVHSTFTAMLGHLRSKALEKFKNDLEQSLKSGKAFAAAVRDCTRASLLEFDRGLEDWDASKVRDKLRRDIDSHAASVRTAKLAKLKASSESKLTEALAGPVESLLEAAGDDTWASIRNLYRRETEKAVSDFTSSLSGFELDQATHDTMIQNLEEFARGVIEKKARDEAGNVLIHMKDRFSTVFNHDKDSLPRVWTGKEDIRAITKEARSAEEKTKFRNIFALKLLVVFAAIRLDDKPDKIENALSSSLLEQGPVSQSRSIEASTDLLASSTWEEIPPRNTLITPVQCKSIWRQFKSETEYTITQAISAQEAHRRSSNWLPPPWAIVAIAILGFNEFMMLLRNPVYILGLFLLFIVSYAVVLQFNILEEFRHGMLSGLLALSARFLPTVMNILRKLADEGHNYYHPPQPPRPSPPIDAPSFRSRSQGQPPLSSNPAPDSHSSSSSPASPTLNSS
uniref:GB1/RHD3-type G domain-containing protein n=1 Tax=Ananas comosus var. bracteatus TaxID=296719 RepID=A0A6V7NV97_ANACO|nr:unnamed protein product [Ananas comosus var. bracteatus]